MQKSVRDRVTELIFRARLTPNVQARNVYAQQEATQAQAGNVLEADLEEIYFYKFDRPGGYAYQRVYTDDRSIDGVMRAQQHDAVLVPAGYHPVVSAHGYTGYYLNFLAGSAQSLANSDDPEFAWVKAEWKNLDPRLPIVSHAME
ncbi:MAG: hypothetical protein HC828_21195 [Blastochloris sp.]|nr:hypothetical protein [Blastochloris sp.]